MHWHPTELSSIFHHFPHSFSDLLHREDKELVKAGWPGLLLKKRDPVGEPSQSAIGRDIDPSIARSQQNIGLLMHEHLLTLPEYVAQTAEAEQLIQHWEKILLEQPHRLAEAHLESWHHEESKQFWQEHLRHHDVEHHLHPLDDWEKVAGTPLISQADLGTLKAKQWHDLVIRQRLHNLDLANMAHYAGSH